MTKTAVQLYGCVKKTHNDAYRLIGDLRDSVRAGQPLKALADMAGIAKRAAELLDDLRKESTKLSELAQKVACAVMVQREDTDTVRGDYVVATPDVKMIPRLPSRTAQPDEYYRMLRALGVPETPMVRVHWPSVVEEMNARLSAGGSLPEGIDLSATYPEYKLVTRMNMAALDAAAAEEKGGEKIAAPAKKPVNEKTRKVIAWLKTQSRK